MPTTVRVHRKTGRPMQPGTLVTDTGGRLGIFITYCPHGDKVVFYKDEIPPLVRRWDRSRKSIRIRVYRRLLAHLSSHVNE